MLRKYPDLLSYTIFSPSSWYIVDGMCLIGESGEFHDGVHNTIDEDGLRAEDEDTEVSEYNNRVNRPKQPVLTFYSTKSLLIRNRNSTV